MKLITQDELKSILIYDAHLGVFSWKETIAKRAKKGAIAGCKNNGYTQIKIYGKIYQAHRLAWLYTYGEFPKGQIDHINHIRSDNRIQNIRSVTVVENSKNKSIRHNNTSGVNGVHFNKRRNKWNAQIKIDGKTIHLGSFEKIEDATKLRKQAEIAHGFHKNHCI